MEQQSVMYTLIYASGWEQGNYQAVVTSKDVSVWAQETLAGYGGTIIGLRISRCNGQRVDWVYDKALDELPWTPEVMPLREALARANGALEASGRSYVGYNEDHHVLLDRPWDYVPDTASQKPETWLLLDGQLEQLVLFAQQACWIPVNNVIL